MPKLRKNYYKKPVGSVAVLGYYTVIPFYNKSACIPQLLEMAENAEDILLRSIQYACKKIQTSFVEGGELYDDGVVEMHPILSETHVTIYMKLPATISIHSAISQTRIHSSKFLLKTRLREYKETYNSLYSSKYLAMCAPYDTQRIACIEGTVYGTYLKTFFLENSLAGDSQNLHYDREKAFGKGAFMSKNVTLYK